MKENEPMAVYTVGVKGHKCVWRSGFPAQHMYYIIVSTASIKYNRTYHTLCILFWYLVTT